MKADLYYGHKVNMNGINIADAKFSKRAGIADEQRKHLPIKCFGSKVAGAKQPVEIINSND